MRGQEAVEGTGGADGEGEVRVERGEELAEIVDEQRGAGYARAAGGGSLSHKGSGGEDQRRENEREPAGENREEPEDGVRSRLRRRSTNQTAPVNGQRPRRTRGIFSSGSPEAGKSIRTPRANRNGYELAGSTPLDTAPRMSRATKRKKLLVWSEAKPARSRRTALTRAPATARSIAHPE